MKKITNPKPQTTNNLQIPMTKLFLVIRILILCIVPIGSNLGFVYWNLDIANAGSVQFSTYYPAPFGMYDRLRLVPRTHLDPPCDPGTMYINTDAGNQLEICNALGDDWAPLSGGPWTENINGVYVTDTTANVGIGTTAPRTRLELGNDGAILATGTFASGWTEPNLGAGVRLLWYPQKAAFRAGQATTTEWNNANIGTYSVAMGYNTKASNTYSTAMGVSTTASGLYSTAMGVSTTASGEGSTAMGTQTTASGGYSTAIGSNTTASGGYSTAMGFYANANGDLSTAMGYYTTAQAYASLVLGRFNVGGGTPNSWVDTDPLFAIGNGVNSGSLSNAMTVLKNGNVGIGTAAPTSRLHVNAPQGDAPPGVFLENADMSVDGGVDGQFALRNNSASGTRKIFLGGPGAAYILTVDALTARVGIGTTAPGGIFHVKGAAPNIYLESTTINGPDLFFSGSGTFDGRQYILYSSGSGNTIGAGKFAIQDETAGATRMVINSVGNVGIGTTDPGTNRLEVVGGPIKATGGLIIPTCTIAAGDCPATPVAGQIWLCTDCP